YAKVDTSAPLSLSSAVATAASASDPAPGTTNYQRNSLTNNVHIIDSARTGPPPTYAYDPGSLTAGSNDFHMLQPSPETLPPSTATASRSIWAPSMERSNRSTISNTADSLHPSVAAALDAFGPKRRDSPPVPCLPGSQGLLAVEDLDMLLFAHDNLQVFEDAAPPSSDDRTLPTYMPTDSTLALISRRYSTGAGPASARPLERTPIHGGSDRKLLPYFNGATAITSLTSGTSSVQRVPSTPKIESPTQQLLPSSGGGTPATTAVVLKRRKVANACVACQRSHVSCEDQRPCSRCLRRGLASSCRDAPHKTFISVTAAQAAKTSGCAGCPLATFSSSPTGAQMQDFPLESLPCIARGNVSPGIVGSGRVGVERDSSFSTEQNKQYTASPNVDSV
ncbi:hypothetical protein HK405_010518, partial [Cladochytrium tenue]